MEKFETLWPDFTQEEKREFVSLLIARIEVRSSEGKSDGRRNARVVELKVKLHLPELLGGGREGDSAPGRLGGRRRSFTLDARVQLAAGTGDAVILSPFHHRVTQLGRKGQSSNKPRRREHPFERAIRWSEFLDRNADCTARELARREKISEPTMSTTLGLRRLAPAIQKIMHLLIATESAYHLGLRALAKIAGLPFQKQSSAFAALLRRWGISPDESVAKEL